MDALTRGDDAPDFDLKDQDGRIVRLGDFKGKKLLIYFYPKADTSGCTKQACTVRDAMPDLGAAGVAAVGISPDSPDKQKKFAEKHGLNFPLLCDEGHSVAQAYGAWGEKKMYGKAYQGIIRSSFLVDENGKIIDAWYKIKPDATVRNAQKALEASP
jgi:thioredoxin-dependent peroxiredoxin